MLFGRQKHWPYPLIAATYVTLCWPEDKGQRRGVEQFGKPKLEYKVVYLSPKPPHVLSILSPYSIYIASGARG